MQPDTLRLVNADLPSRLPAARVKASKPSCGFFPALLLLLFAVPLTAQTPDTTVVSVSTFDSTRLGDTVRFERGRRATRTITSTQFISDSVWYRFPPPALGIPYGPFNLWATAVQPNALTEGFTLSHDAVPPRDMVAHINAARQRRVSLILVLTGGNHAKYLKNGVFSDSLWRREMDQYNTPPIVAAIAAGVSDATIRGASMIDEPANSSTGSGGGDANAWGPPGTITKPMLDSMARYLRRRFPTLPAGFLGRYDWRQTETFTDVDFRIMQYSHRLPEDDPGNITRWLAESQAQCLRDGIACGYSLNVLNGGIKTPRFKFADWERNNALWTCPLETTGGRGLKPGNCRMHPSQVESWGKLLGSAGIALLMWRMDSTFFAQPANRLAFQRVTAKLVRQPRPDFRRLCLVTRPPTCRR